MLKGPLSSTRGRAAYVCGDVAGLAITALLPDHDLPAAWKAAREQTGGGFGHDALFATLEARGAPVEGVAAVRTFVTTEHEDPAAAVVALLTAAGLEPVVDQGTVQRVEVP